MRRTRRFQQRIDLRRKNNPDFRWEFEDYELEVCRFAALFAETFKTSDGIAAWIVQLQAENVKRLRALDITVMQEEDVVANNRH